MRVLILEHTVADGRDVSAGDVVDISNAAAAILTAMGRATRTLPAEKPAPVAFVPPEPAAVIETAEASSAPETAVLATPKRRRSRP